MSHALPKPQRPRSLRNWLSLSGAVIAGGAFFAFILLFAIDSFSRHDNPYMGILAYVVAPGFLFLGIFLFLIGAWIHRRHLRRTLPGGVPHVLSIDLSRPRDRRMLVGFGACTVIFLLATALGSYQTYHFSESVRFCGQTCHGPMKPEFTAYLNSPHARVACVECHVGGGASAFVKAKMNGVHQLICTFTGDFERPIKTPVKNLRPAPETCEHCHWPQKFTGNLDRSYDHFLSDEANTPFSVRLLLDVGGAAHPHQPAGGIHWHVSPSNRVEYLAIDRQRQIIPWVRLTKADGSVVEYRSPDFKDDIAKYEIRTMDCVDCHNRPAHAYNSPNDEVDKALHAGRIDRAMPWVRSNVVYALIQPYATETEALEKIAAQLRSAYPGHPKADALVAEAQRIFKVNFFPEMKADWRAYPDHRGHKESPGCFRCHDGKHATSDGKLKIAASDCNSCHMILAQGSGEDLLKLNPKGYNFFHVDSEYSDFDCNSCHTGAFPK